MQYVCTDTNPPDLPEFNTKLIVQERHSLPSFFSNFSQH
jgi:hypothetical protein